MSDTQRRRHEPPRRKRSEALDSAAPSGPRGERSYHTRPAMQPASIGSDREGSIKRVNLEKGFGFIRDAGGAEYFFHLSACNDIPGGFAALTEGQPVIFDSVASVKGPRAQNLRSAI